MKKDKLDILIDITKITIEENKNDKKAVEKLEEYLEYIEMMGKFIEEDNI